MADVKSFVIISALTEDVEGEISLEVDENTNVIDKEDLISKLIYEGVISPSEEITLIDSHMGYDGFRMDLYNSKKSIPYFLVLGTRESYKPGARALKFSTNNLGILHKFNMNTVSIYDKFTNEIDTNNNEDMDEDSDEDSEEDDEEQ